MKSSYPLVYIYPAQSESSLTLCKTLEIRLWRAWIYRSIQSPVSFSFFSSEVERANEGDTSAGPVRAILAAGHVYGEDEVGRVAGRAERTCTLDSFVNGALVDARGGTPMVDLR